MRGEIEGNTGASHVSLNVYFSDVFGVDPTTVDDHGAFDVSLVGDIPLFVDPFLLFCSDRPGYRLLHDGIIDYLRFLRDRAGAGRSASPVADWFRFPEVAQNWFGFSVTGNRGRGLGRGFAGSLERNLTSVFRDFGEETVTQGSHLEKLALIDPGVGRDMISDFTTNLIKGFLLEFTQSYATQHIDEGRLRRVAVRRVRFDYGAERWMPETFILPWYEAVDDYVILTPKDMLTRDDTWISRGDLHRRLLEIPAAMDDQALREQVNRHFLAQLPPSSEPSAADIDRAKMATLREFPVLIDLYIRLQEDRSAEALESSRRKVSNSHNLYVAKFRQLPQLLLQFTDFYGLAEGTYAEARKRVEYLKDVVENKGGYKILYLDGEPLRRERDLHILYRLVWCGSPSDVSREVDDGGGPADFKISRGAWDKTIVEFKLASNTRLRKNLRAQAEVYQAASDAEHALKVIFFFTEQEQQKIQKILHELGLSDHPAVYLVDARSDNKPTGSRAA